MKKSKRKRRKRSRCHADRNDGGGGHHRDVRGAWYCRECWDRRTVESHRGTRADQRVYDGTRFLQNGQRRLPHHRARLAGAAREARGNARTGRGRIRKRRSVSIPGSIHISITSRANTETIPTLSASAPMASPAETGSMPTLSVGKTNRRLIVPASPSSRCWWWWRSFP